MRKVSHKPFEIWLEQQNTHDRLHPNAGIELKANQTNLQVYRTSKTNLLQRLWRYANGRNV